ncbi:inositol monophosphatase [Patescibacteria group bacterium]|nr:inositol monophosphatase [Patescibacteria group bacterium]
MTKELKFATNLAKDAGKILMDEFGKAKILKTKADKRDVCTNVDLKTEQMIIGKIKENYPDHKIYGEETGKTNGESDYTWIIDPIDGTRYYISGIKFFSVSIALWKDNEPILGVVYFPALDEIYYAEKGKGAFCDKKKLKVSSISNLKDSIIALDIACSNKLELSEKKTTTRRLETIFANTYRIRLFGLGTFVLCSIAKGGFEGYFDLTGKEKVLDLVAGIIIAKEAGAKITGLDGKYLGKNTSHVVITNGKIHNKFLELINSIS